MPVDCVGIALAELYDLLDYPVPSASPDVIRTLKEVFGSDTDLFEDNIRDAFQKAPYTNDRDHRSAYNLAHQAWLATIVGKKLIAKRDIDQLTPYNLKGRDKKVCRPHRVR